jgi:signal transduction histidine kinase
MSESFPATTSTSESASTSRMMARERVRAMESLAGIIAQEIRSAVLGVTSAAQLLRYAMPQDPVAEKSLGRILQESDRLSALHEALTEYATEIPPRTAAGDPDALWESVIRNMRGALEASSVIVVHESAAASVAIDQVQLGRAFERIIHQAMVRGRTGAELRIASTVNEHDWLCTVSIARFDAGSLTGEHGRERASFLLALANRTVVAHGGETTDHSGDDPRRVVSIRLPLLPAVND